jgi:pyridinium-3,5-biscarboxylic acid mononucleotide synthase
MNEQSLTTLLQQVRTGTVEVGQALDRLRRWPVEVLESARIDHHRSIRTGLPEAVFGESKTVDHLTEILTAMLRSSSVVLATRVSAEKAATILARLPELTYHPTARILTGNKQFVPTDSGYGTVVIVTAGTSDIAVAEEARLTLELFGHAVATIYDAGVAGIHRILAHSALLQQGRVIIVAAGMEGALPSVVAGLTGAPVIGVPTSIGYGAGAGGYSALLGMLNSCSPGLAVVNIDNGFGAACMAAAINRKVA